MAGSVRLNASFWVDTCDMSIATRLLYLWCFSNSHVSGITGIGHVPDVIIRGETGMSAEELADGKQALQQANAVRWYQKDWFWVVKRAQHTCVRAAGTPNPKLLKGASQQILQAAIPQELVMAFRKEYEHLDMSQDAALNRTALEHINL